MGNTDSIPVISQAKSTVQLVCGDTDGAAKTQENFFKECPGVSQVTSLVQLASGDPDGALETQKRCGKGLLNAADGIPVVGHVKGVVHYACGDTEGGNQAMKSATRTTGVLAAGAGGFVVGGPAGAVAGGIYGGAVMDMGTTVVTQKSTGYVAALENAVKNPNPGDLFDLAMMPVSDGVAGYAAGNAVNKIQQSSARATAAKAGKTMEAKGVALYEITEAKLEANPNMPTGEYVNGMRQAQNLINEGKNLQGKSVVYAVDQLKAGTSTTKTGAQSVSITVPCHVEDQQDNVGKRQKTRSRMETKSATKKENKSDEDSDDECTCKKVKLTVLYVNASSINPHSRQPNMISKIEKIKSLIQRYDPVIIAIVESWLTIEHSNDEVRQKLGLGPNYFIDRQDRNDGHHPNNSYGNNLSADAGRTGGGILVAWKTSYSGTIITRDPSEDYADNIVNLDINRTFHCENCVGQSSLTKQYGLTIIYRRPKKFKNQGKAEFDEVNEEVISHIQHIPYWYDDDQSPYQNSGWAIVGDFNWRSGNVLRSFIDPTVAEVVRLSRDSTHNKGGALDQVIAKHGFVSSVNDCSLSMVDVTDLVSDHCALVFNLNLGQDYSDDDPCEAENCN